jgi:hypothetical protein
MRAHCLPARKLLLHERSLPCPAEGAMTLRNLNLGCAVFNAAMFVWLGSPISLFVGLANGFTFSILSHEQTRKEV